MTDEPKVIFVNTMTVSGFLNGNCNLTFTTARWSARSRDGEVYVDANEYESLFLRMDLNCATQVRDALDKIIAQQSKPGTVN